MAVDIGKLFEKEMQGVFDTLKDSSLIGWHRLADTGSAGGSFIQAQPSDYLLALPPGSRSPLNEQRLLFVEVKASETNDFLTRKAMKPSQRGAICYYRQVLKLPYLVIFYAAHLGQIQVWDGAAVPGTGKLDKLHLLATLGGAGHGKTLNRPKVAEFLSEWFHLPEKSGILAAL